MFVTWLALLCLTISQAFTIRKVTAMSAEFDMLKKVLDGYVAAVQTKMDQHKAEVDAAVAKALADHDETCTSDAQLKTLLDEISAANAKLVPPPFEPSGNG